MHLLETLLAKFKSNFDNYVYPWNLPELSLPCLHIFIEDRIDQVAFIHLLLIKFINHKQLWYNTVLRYIWDLWLNMIEYFHLHLTLNFFNIACKNVLLDYQVHVRFSIVCILNCNDLFDITMKIECFWILS